MTLIGLSQGLFLVIQTSIICLTHAAAEYEFENILPSYTKSYILNGHRAELGQLPWMVYLLIEDGREQLSCTGVLLNANTVLTAAHCLCKDRHLKVTLKAGVIEVEGGKEKGQTREALKYKIPSAFNQKVCRAKDVLYPFDIGIVKVKGHFKLNRYVQPVKLGCRKLAVGTAVKIMGFGDDQNKNFGILNVAHVNTSECELRGFEVCSKNPTKSIYVGDSGGPLIAKSDDGKYRVVGVNNGGSGIAGYTRWDNYYTSVHKFCHWINRFLPAEERHAIEPIEDEEHKDHHKKKPRRNRRRDESSRRNEDKK